MSAPTTASRPSAGEGPVRRAVAATLAGHARRLLFACMVALAVAAPLHAHDVRQIGEYQFVVGFIGEPVFTGDESGLELFVTKNENPVEDLETTLVAEVIYGDARRDLPLSPTLDRPGAYESIFIPTSAGPYTFHIRGTIEGTPIDTSFTSSPTGFEEVQELTAGQFPVQFPAPAELAADARRGRDAAAQLPLALALGAAGTILGLTALGVALAGRRRRAG
jgi:hypothetical protein